KLPRLQGTKLTATELTCPPLIVKLVGLTENGVAVETAPVKVRLPVFVSWKRAVLVLTMTTGPKFMAGGPSAKLGGPRIVTTELAELLFALGSGVRAESVMVFVNEPANAPLTTIVTVPRVPLVIVPRLEEIIPPLLVRLPRVLLPETKLLPAGSGSTKMASEQ